MNIENVQRGVIFIEKETSGEGTVFNIPISAVDLTAAIPSVTINTDGDGRPNKDQFKVELTSSTNLRLTRFTDSFSNENLVSWEVTDFDADEVNVQSGTVDASSATENILLTTVTVNDTIPFVYHASDRLANVDQVRTPEATITSATNLQLVFNAAPGTDDYKSSWFVADFNSGGTLTVQSGTVSFPNTDGTKDVTVTSVDLTKALVQHWPKQSPSSAVWTKIIPTVFMLNATTIRWEILDTATSAETVTGKWYIFEIFGDETVQSGQTNITGGNLTADATLTDIEVMNTAMIWTYHGFSNLAGDSGSRTAAQNGWAARRLISTTALRFSRLSSTGTVKQSWQVLDGAAAAAAPAGGGDVIFQNDFN